MIPASLTSGASTFGAKRPLAALALAVAAISLAPSAWAASGTWLDTGSTNASWNTSSNWTGGTIPGSTATITGTNANADTATFSSAVGTYGTTGNPIIIDSASENIKSITFSGSAGNYFIGTTSGNSLYLSSGGTISIATGASATAVETINAPLVIEGTNGTYTFNNALSSATSNLVLGGTISGGAAGNTLITFSGGTASVNYANGIISNGSATTLGLLQTTSNWTYAAANTYTGATYVEGGTANFTGANTASGSVTVGLNPGYGGAAAGGNIDLGGANGSFASASSITIGNGGNFIYDNTTASINARLGSSQVINLDGGTFSYKGITTGTSTASAGSVYQLALNTDQTSSLSTTVASGTGNTSTLTIGSISVGTGATLSASLGSAALTTGKVVVTTAPTADNGIIPWAIETSNGAFLSIGTGNTIGAYGNINSDTYQTGASNSWAATDNVKLTTGTTTASASNLTINSLSMLQSAATTLDLGGNTFIIGSGGVLSNGGYASTIQDGNLTAGNTAGSYTLYLWNNSSSGTQTISAAIADDSGNAVTVIKAGANATVLAGTNTYTGPTIVDGGTLTINTGASTSATSAVTVGQGGTLTNNGTIGGNVTVGNANLAAVSGGLSSTSTALTPNFTNNGTVSGTLTINSSGVQSVNANNAPGYVTGIAQINPGSTTGSVTDNGVLQFEGAAGATTIGTIGGSGGQGAIVDGNTSSSGISLTLASGSSFAYFRPTNSSGTSTATLAVAGGGTNATSFSYFGYNDTLGGSANVTLNGGTFNINSAGQNNSTTGFLGTVTVTNGSTVNIATNGGYLHGTWNVTNGSLTTVGLSAAHNDTTISPLVVTVNNTGGGSGSTVSVTGTANVGLVGLTASATNYTNEFAVGTGGTFTVSGSLTAGNTSAYSTGFSELDEILVQGGTLNANGGVIVGSNGSTSANNTDLLTVSSGTANITGALTLGTTTAAAGAVTNTVTLSGGKLNISTALSASTATNLTDAFNWTGGILSARTITPSAAFNGSGSSINSTTLTNNGASGTTLAPGTIGTPGETTINGAYSQGSNGTLAIDLGGATQANAYQNTGSYYGYLSVGTTVALGGNLTLSFSNGFTPSTGTFTIVNSGETTETVGSLSGTFNTGGTTQFQTGQGTYAGGFYVLPNSNGLNGLLLGYTAGTASTHGAATLTYTASTNTYAGAASSAWDATAAGSWTQFDPGSASGGLGSLAVFGNDSNALSGPIAVSLSSVRDVQGINFSSTVAGNNYTITGSGSGAITFDNTGNSTAAAITDTSAMGNSNTIAAPITLNSSLNASANAGNTLTLSGNISGTGNGVSATGNGTVILTGNNTYTGPTYATGGTLLVNNTAGSGTGSGSIGVSNSVNFGGTGSITPGTGNTVAIYGNLSSGIAGTAGSGNAVGNGFTINAANLHAASAVNFEGVSTLSFNLGSGNTASTLNLTNTGSFTGEVAGLSGDTFNFTDLTAGSTLNTGLYTLVATDSTNSALFAGLTVGNLTESINGLASYQAAGDQVSIQLNQVGGVYDIQLDITAVPEPSTWAMMLFGGVALLFFFQRRKSVSSV